MKLISYYDLLGMIKEGNIPDKVYWINNRKEKISYKADYDIEFNCYFLENINEEKEDIAFYLVENLLESDMFKECIEIPNDDFEDIEDIPFNNGMKEFIDVYLELEKYNYKINDLIRNQKKIINMLKEDK